MKKIIFFASILAALVSCQKNDSEGFMSSVDETLMMNISMDIATKVTDTSFESGDEVGIYVVNYVDDEPDTLAVSGNHYDNVKHTYSTSWTAEEAMYWMDKTTKADFYCYYPYGTPTSMKEYPFSIKVDQSLQSDYKESDFIWGKTSGVAPTSSSIQIASNHVMSNMVIYIQPGDGFTAESLAASDVSVAICNVKTNSTVNLTDGEVTDTGDVNVVTPYNEGTYYRAVIVPQTVPSGSALVSVTVDGTEYTFKKGFTFVSGKQHKFTVKVNKTGSGVNVGIGGWETDEEDNGGSAE